MIFSSITFLFYFLPLFLGLYYIFPRIRNWILLVFSMLFYAWGEPVYIGLLVFSISMNYGFGRWIDFSRGRGDKWVLAGAVVANLAVLAFFKYGYFCVSNIESLTGVHVKRGIDLKNLLLPLGISFYTFQALSYLIDLYRQHAPVEKNPFMLGNYIFMFPQLIAGPIVRYASIYAQLRERSHSLEKFCIGMRWFSIGLASKVLVANIVAVPADEIFGLDPIRLSSGLAWFGLWCYTIQIYFDFMGYSLMAIGLGKMMGFEFPQNFNSPYSAKSVTDFWQRWHMSLTTWFKDYLYIPLGGNRRGNLRTYLNLIVVFLLCGFWHGASWNFMAWGAYHGCFLVMERILQFSDSQRRRGFGLFFNIYQLFVVMIGWVFFRSENMDKAFQYILGLSGFGESERLLGIRVELFLKPYPLLILFVATLLALVNVGRIFHICMNFVESANARQRKVVEVVVGVGAVILLVLSVAALASGSYNPFIYFRF